ncbi:MAG: Ig-like domain-containing protein [Muribaculaceae bacterium]|nr:Ig-like domain-containing protein [Muribaculaceae bacterium]
MLIIQCASSWSINVPISITGLLEGDQATVTISSNEYLDVKNITSNGQYEFTNVPVGRHTVGVNANGYIASQALMVEIDQSGNILPPTTLKFSITKNEENSENFRFEWGEDGTVAGYTTSCNVNEPVKIEFLGKQIIPADVPSQHNLLSYFQIILSNDEEAWTEEFAYRLWQTMQTFEIASQDNEPGYHPERPHSQFLLTSELLPDDMIITDMGDGNKIVKISKDAFTYANPYFVSLEGVKGRFYSKRLHHAMTKYITDFGKNLEIVNHILLNRFGCEVLNIDYETLTSLTTFETADHFQMFHPSELVAIINMFEELPEGFHKTDHLKYLIRRLDTHPHPIYPDAAAVSWPLETGYIEFMDKAFGGNNEHFDTQRLILHEKTHFLWAFTFNEEIKSKWIEIGKWYKIPVGENEYTWATEDSTGFVSQYAHDHNPDEDMAESIAYYLKDPEWLRSRNTEKYDFICNYIMHGVKYISKIPDQFTFEVFNLWPDYDYPGKITKIEVNAIGAPDEDKKVTLDVWLNHVEGCQDGASSGWTRIFSPQFLDQHGVKKGHYYDLAISPVDGDQFHLRGEVTVQKNTKSGDWSAYSIALSDENGNARFSSSANDYVWKLQINNSDEDLWTPEYEEGSLKYELYDSTDSEGHPIQILRPMFKAYDDRMIIGSYMGIGIKDADQYGRAAWGNLVDPINPKGGWIDTKLEIMPYFRSGEYFVGSIAAYDPAGNGCWVLFPDDEPIKYQEVITPDPDTVMPEVDLNRVTIYAEPTNPEAPNGETKVSISLFVRDDKSGVEGGTLTLRDPQGGQYSFVYGVSGKHNYWDKNAHEWEHVIAQCTLAPGSVPGIWGLAEISASDKALNSRTFNLVETLIFEPDDDDSKYILFAEMDDNDMLYLKINSVEGKEFNFEYRVIHEESGMEISGSNLYDQRKRISSQSLSNSPYSINVSSLPDGDLIVITNIYNNFGEIESAKSFRITKSSIIIAEEIILNKNQVELYINETVELEATILPEDATDKSVEWSSSDESVATVSEEGEVTALSVGKAIITARCGDVSATCEVTVQKSSGLERLFANPDNSLSVYTTDGVLIKRDCKVGELKTLHKGIYIIVSGKERYKISI